MNMDMLELYAKWPYIDSKDSETKKENVMSLSLMRPFAGFDEMFEHFNRPLSRNNMGDWMPAVDVEEDDKSYQIKAELPGVSKDDVHVSVENNILTIKGEKKIKTEDKKLHRVERSYGSFVRSFTLPHTVESNKIDAKYTDGILNLVIPKAEEVINKAIDIEVK